MGLRDRFRFVRDVATSEPSASAPSGDPAAQAFTVGGQIGVADVIAAAFSGGLDVTRAQALSVPGVLRARNLICSISTLPLVTLDPARKPVRESLFEQIDPDVANVVTLAATVEDLLCDGVSWWQVLARGWNDFPTSARHVDPTRVSLDPPPGYRNLLPSGVDPRQFVWIDGKPASKRDVIRFDSPNPGILQAARRTIRRAVKFEQTAEMYADDPRAQDYFTRREGGTLADPSPEQISEYMAAWIAARRARATGYVPDWLEHHVVNMPTPADLQLAELQRQAALDIANVTGIDPEDLGVSTTSRTYQNATDRRQDRVNDVFAGYMRAITDRLSMGDVTRRGYKVVFDLNDYMKADPTTRWGVYQTAVAMGAYDLADVAVAEGLPEKPRRAPASAAPRPAPEDPASQAQPADNSAQEAHVRLSEQTFAEPVATAGQTFRFEDDGQTFRASAEKRTVSGLLLPYGAVGRNGQGRWRFAKGSVEWPKATVSRVKLNREHDRGNLLGAATEIKGSDDGIAAAFKVARGAAGDQALSEAEDDVLDGLSAEVDILDYTVDPDDEGVYLVTRARLTGAALTGTPAFDDARLTSVAASTNTKGSTTMKCTVCGMEHAAGTPCATPTPVVLSAEDRLAAIETALARLVPAQGQPPAAEGPTTVDPAVRPVGFVSEPLPYRFDRGGNFTRAEHDFASDLVAAVKAGDTDGVVTPAGKRVMGLLQTAFATVATDDINELNPAIQRPDMYVAERDVRTPIWELINKGAPPNGVQPFTFPKFSSASGLVGDHTEETEPTAGTFVTTSQTVTPTALSGKAEITRETWDMGGNPATSTLIFNKMRREYFSGLETAAATFLNTLTAAADLTVTTAAVDKALAASLEGHLAGLQFADDYDFSGFVVEEILYLALAAAVDDNGRKIYPVVNPQNASGQARPRFQALDIAGYLARPSGALASTADAANNSWLFDPSTVHGWATPPMRLELQGTKGTEAAPVAFVDVAVWGYKAFANSDIGGVRQVIYDETA